MTIDEVYNWKIIAKLDHKKRYLIDYANLIDNLFIPQNNFLNEKNYNIFLKKPYLGMPFLLPENDKHFKFIKKDTSNFKVSNEELANKLFNTSKKNYLGVKLMTLKGNIFNNDFILKKKYKNLVNEINKFNNVTKQLVKLNHIKKYKIAAFQTRNIPHIGHQKIIEFLLDKFDRVIINPVLGPKKKNDIRNDVLRESWQFLINNVYGEKLKFWPIIANMFYGGPREAVHHAILRQNIGFKNFLIGRDHAGAENIYKTNEAGKLIEKNKDKLNINIIIINGAFYSKEKKEAVILTDFTKNTENLMDISGTNFRKYLKNKKIYKYANSSMQIHIHNTFTNIFQK